MNSVYQIRQVIKYLFVLGAVMLAMYLTKGTGFLIVVPLLAFSLVKGDVVGLFFYLLLTIVMLTGNQFLMPKNLVFAIAQRGLLVSLGGIMALRCFGWPNSTCLKPLLLMSLYLIVAVASSLWGWNATISLMKIFLFAMVYFAYFGVANQVATRSRGLAHIRVRSAFLAVAIFFIVGSIALIPFPGIGQLSGLEYEEAIKAGKEVNSLFKGMTMHSQSLGPIVVMLFVIIVGDLILSVRRMDMLYIALIMLCPILVFMTSSRTAMGGLLFGVLVLFYYAMKARGLRSNWKSKVVTTFFLILIVGSVLALVAPSVREGIGNFATKSKGVNSTELTFEKITSSRLGKWEEGIANFKRSPFIGNGFQVSEDMASIRAGLTVLSAPVEKSVWISAVLEETGLVGFSVFVFFVLVVTFRGNSNRCYIGNTAFLTLLVSNMGEFTIFSMSYTGGFQWAMVFVGYMFDATRNRALTEMPIGPFERGW